MAVVLDLFRECIGEPSKSAHLHSHSEVVPLGKSHVEEAFFRDFAGDIEPAKRDRSGQEKRDL
jgi:hypothetical protein